MSIKAPKKLIEVALPLDDINAAAAREKSIRHGHPSTLHLWWARRPLAAARAVLFAQMVNDPGGERGWTNTKTKEQAAQEREELFDIIRDLVKWENTNNEAVLERARAAIRKSWRETCELNKGKPGFDPDRLPAFHDPFAGGGAIPLEAKRLGLEAHASDLNPVAVLINKAMIEIPPKFAGRAPVGPLSEEEQGNVLQEWPGATGLAEDVRRYGAWIREEAFKRIGHLYPKVDVKTGLPVRHGEEQPGQEAATVIAWIWARTVKSPNPAFSHLDVPLVSTFLLSSREGREAWVDIMTGDSAWSFAVRSSIVHGKPPHDAKSGTKLARGANFRCALSGSLITPEYIKAEGVAGRFGARLMAVVAEGPQGRLYLTPTPEMEAVASSATPYWRPEAALPNDPRNFWTPSYGLSRYCDLFTARQTVALTTFSDLIGDLQNRVTRDCETSRSDLAEEYASAVAQYVSFAIDKGANYWSSLCSWHSGRDTITSTFGRQALPMVWDYAEANPFSASSGNFLAGIEQACKLIANSPSSGRGYSIQSAAQLQTISEGKVVSTDPPYYDNIAYADLSDFFYVWLRRSLRGVYPELFATLAVPKEEELVASPYRHGGKEAAENYFMKGMTQALTNLAQTASAAFPVTIYYAFKQSDASDLGTSNTGWETFLEAVLHAGFSLTGTWPMRTEYTGNLKKSVNALASSIVLVCRKRDPNAPTISRREFIRELKSTLPQALEDMTNGAYGRSPVAPVDLAQAIIGPGMEVFSKYSAVLEADGSPMTVHTALILINTYLPGDPDEFDADTRFCLTWFETYGWSRDAFGEADVLARAKGTSVDRLAQSGVLESGSGKVKLLRATEYPTDWQPEKDALLPVWEAAHQLIRAHQAGGDQAAGELLARIPEKTEQIRQLAYRLYTLCERKGWAEEARTYNELMTAWPEITNASNDIGRSGSQSTFF